MLVILETHLRQQYVDKYSHVTLKKVLDVEIITIESSICLYIVRQETPYKIQELNA